MATRLITVNYGHGTKNGNGGYSASGQNYDYETDKEYRAGDVVVVPVTHWKSGKTYNTVAVVQTTHAIDGKTAQSHIEAVGKDNMKNTSMRLEVAKKQGLNVETDRQVNITTLPGYESRLSSEKWSEKQTKPKENTTRFISRGGG